VGREPLELRPLLRTLLSELVIILERDGQNRRGKGGEGGAKQIWWVGTQFSLGVKKKTKEGRKQSSVGGGKEG